MKTKLPQIATILILLILASCGLKGMQIPKDKLDYVGLWKSAEISLSISSGGKVDYEKKSGGSSTSINAPIQKFEGNNFVVGALGINTTFVVSEIPHKDSTGLWKMTVDGVELTRKQ